MEGVYPIIIDGDLAGKLTVTARGPLTEFAAVCRLLPGIVRISVYGGGREGCLGVLAPEGDNLTLQKRLSRIALGEFPTHIDSVERSGLLAEHCRAIAAAPASPEGEPQNDPRTEELRTAAAPQPAPETAARKEAEEVPAPELQACAKDEDLYWYASPDGALVRFDGAQNLVALPLGDPRIPEGGGGQQRRVEGREYVVFRMKNGRLLR